MISLKCCGFQRVGDVKKAVNYPLSAIGFILVPGRKRTVSREQLPLLVELVPERILSVGVFANPTLQELEKWLSLAPIRAIQLHGDETADFCREVKRRWPKCKVIKAFHLGDTDFTPLYISAFAPHIDVALLDSSVHGLRGGTGKVFDWQLITEYQETCRKNQLPLWVAGGIGVDNVDRLLSQYPIQGVDVSSGIESNGEKDESLISELVRKVDLYGTIQ